MLNIGGKGYVTQDRPFTTSIHPRQVRGVQLRQQAKSPFCLLPPPNLLSVWSEPMLSSCT